jgi:pimeloyl-ACP methyl ester carboxylesterase
MVNLTTDAPTKERIGLVFIHGAGLNSGIWKGIAEQLECPCLLVDFPQRQSGQVGRKGLTLEDYTEHIKHRIEDWGVRRFVIAAHSLGGVLALKTAEQFADRVVGFAGIGAVIPGSGGAFLSAFPAPQRLLMRILMRAAGTKPPESAIRKGLCNDLPAKQADEIVHGFVQESLRVFTDRTNASVPRVPRLYVKLTIDQELSPSQQDKMIENLGTHEIVTLEAGHLPMLSKPDELREALLAFLSRLEV